MKRLDSNGFEHVGLLVVVLVIGVIGFAGYRVWQGQQDKTPVSEAVSSSSPTQQATNSIDDLEQADDTLDTTATDLDASLDSSTLDSDINDML